MHLPNHPQQVLGQSPSPAASPGWWSKNWGWVVAGTLISFILLLGGAFLTMKAAMTGAFQTMEVYRRPIAAAQDSPWVHEQIGEPVSIAPMADMRGNINVSNSEGEADLAIPIYGPRGSATIYTEAIRTRGQWQYSRMVVEVDETGEWTDLLR